MLFMISQFVLFEDTICLGGGYGSEEICVLLLEILDGVVLVAIIVTAVWCGYLLHAI